MKSTYKLLGLFWDGLPAADDDEPVAEYSPLIEPIESPRNLFDARGYRRTVSMSELLSAPETSALPGLVERVRECDEVYLLLDGVPRFSGAIPRMLYRLRSLQALAFLRREAPTTHVSLMWANPLDGDEGD